MLGYRLHDFVSQDWIRDVCLFGYIREDLCSIGIACSLVANIVTYIPPWGPGAGTFYALKVLNKKVIKERDQVHDAHQAYAHIHIRMHVYILMHIFMHNKHSHIITRIS